MIIRNIRYFLNQASKNLYHNRLMSITSIITVFASVLIFVASYTLMTNIEHIMGSLESKLGFGVFLNDEVPANEITTIQAEIESLEGVASVDYISSQDALVNLKATYPDNQDIFTGLENDNPLPRAFEVTLDNADASADAIAQLEPHVGEDKSFSSISHAQAQTDMLISIRNAITLVGVILILVLGFISIVIISNTIRVTIEARKQEINIMKYVGATNSFIVMPFIFEGVFVGFIGSIIPPFVLLFTYDVGISAIYSNLTFLQDNTIFLSAQYIFDRTLPLALLMGIAIGIFSSMLSIRKHLKV